MNVIIKKYGGSSVSSIAKISKIADNIASEYASNKKIVVVLSAMGDSTDKLASFASKISNNPNSRDYDMLLSSGEQVSISLLSMILNEKGIKSKSYTGWQAGIKTNLDHNHARITSINTKKIISHIINRFSTS